MVGDILIEDGPCYTLRSNIPGRSGRSLITSGINYKSIILTPKHIIEKYTRLIYLLSVDVSTILKYTSIDKTINNEIKLFISMNDNEYWFRFKTKKPELWESELGKLGIPKTTRHLDD